MPIADATSCVEAIIEMLHQQLRQSDLKALDHSVTELDRDLALRNLFKRHEPGEPLPMMDQKPHEIRQHLKRLRIAISKDQISEAMRHTEAARRASGTRLEP